MRLSKMADEEKDTLETDSQSMWEDVIHGVPLGKLFELVNRPCRIVMWDNSIHYSHIRGLENHNGHYWLKVFCDDPIPLEDVKFIRCERACAEDVYIDRSAMPPDDEGSV